MKVAEPATATLWRFVTSLWHRFWFEIRFSFFKEEKNLGKAKTHFRTDGVTTNEASLSTLR